VRASRRRALCALVFAASVAAPALAEEPSLADKETARSLFFEGDERYRAGDFEAALEAFRAADAIMGVPTTGVEVGRTLAKLGRLLEAVEVLQRVANLPLAPGENTLQVQARAEASELLERTRSEVPSIQVTVEGIGSAVPALRIDGRVIPASAHTFPRKVDPGEHLVEVSAEGFREKRRRVRVEKARHERLVFVLEPLEETSATLDDPAAETPDDSAGIFEALPIWAWVGFGVGGAGMLGGGIAGGITLARVGELEDRCAGHACPTSERERLEEARAVAHGATASFVIGGAGLAVGLAGLVWMMVGEEEPAVTPIAGPGFVGFGGRF
jgi:hypothetical protein